MIFLSRAANFNFRQAMHHLTCRGRQSDRNDLNEALEERYGGKSILFHNGRTAISEALKMYLQPGDAVAVNGLTCYAVRQSVIDEHEVVFLDIDFDSANYTPETLEAAVKKNPKIKAFIIQNMLGMTVDIRPFEKLAEKYNLMMLEDLAHCIGAQYRDGREVGTVGPVVMLSFGKNKVIDTIHGGALIIRDSAKAAAYTNHPTHQASLLERMRDRLYPIIGYLTRKFYCIKLGPAIMASAIKLKLVVRSVEGPLMPHVTITKWQARLALEQFKRLDDDVARRRKNAQKLSKLIPDAIKTYSDVTAIGSSPLRYPLLVRDRDQLIKLLMKQGYYFDDTWYDVPVSPKRYYHKINFPEAKCPNATLTASEMLNIPLNVAPHRLETAVKVIEDWLER